MYDPVIVPSASPLESTYRSGFPPGARPAANSYSNGVGIYQKQKFNIFSKHLNSLNVYQLEIWIMIKLGKFTSVVVVFSWIC